MDELRSLFSLRIARGALLRADGGSVALVGSGAPPWELLAATERAAAGADYHRILLALEAPLDIYIVDEPPDLAREIELLFARQDAALDAGHELHAAILGEIAGYLSDLAHEEGARAKRVIWALTVAADQPVRAASNWRDLLHGARRRGMGALSDAERAALARAAEQARRLADALGALGGSPPPRPLEPEEIAALIYRTADPIRARRFAPTGRLLDQMRRVLTAAPTPQEPRHGIS